MSIICTDFYAYFRFILFSKLAKNLKKPIDGGAKESGSLISVVEEL
jgi:hypothetical protein